MIGLARNVMSHFHLIARYWWTDSGNIPTTSINIDRFLPKHSKWECRSWQRYDVRCVVVLMRCNV